MKRKDIKGFTVKVFGYCIEFVFVKYLFKCVAIYKKDNRHLVKRFEVTL